MTFYTIKQSINAQNLLKKKQKVKNVKIKKIRKKFFKIVGSKKKIVNVESF